MGQPRPLLSFIFGLFKQISLQSLQQIYWKCPSSIQCWDSNPQTSEHESPSITTRLGLPPNVFICFYVSSPNEVSRKSCCQCDQMAWLFFNIWSFTTMKICPIPVFAIIVFQILSKFNPQNRRRLCQSGGISPNLVTSDYNSFFHLALPNMGREALSTSYWMDHLLIRRIWLDHIHSTIQRLHTFLHN